MLDILVKFIELRIVSILLNKAIFHDTPGEIT
jgi:hypothetical protein